MLMFVGDNDPNDPDDDDGGDNGGDNDNNDDGDDDGWYYTRFLPVAWCAFFRKFLLPINGLKPLPFFFLLSFSDLDNTAINYRLLDISGKSFIDTTAVYLIVSNIVL